MSFLDDFRPLVTGPWLRLVAFWIELVVAALSLVSQVGIWIYAVFALGILLATLDLSLAIRRHKLCKDAYVLDQRYVFQPKIRVIVLDLLLGACSIALFCLSLVGGVTNYYDEPDTYGFYIAQYTVFGAFVLIGTLAIAHLHIFFGSIEIHFLRQLKNGKAAAKRAESWQQAKDRAGVELVQGPAPLADIADRV